MEQRNVVLSLLVPADQYGAETIHPTVSPFHYPTPRFDPRLPFELLRLFSPTMNVRRETEFLKQFPYLVIVIAFVHAHALPLCWRRLRPFDGDAFQGLFDQFHVVAVGSIHGQPDR